jgi:hypothetical protein
MIYYPVPIDNIFFFIGHKNVKVGSGSGRISNNYPPGTKSELIRDNGPQIRIRKNIFGSAILFKIILKLVKTTFKMFIQWCREGTYRLMTLAEYSRPSRVGYASQQGAGSAPVKVNRTFTVQGSNPEQREMCLHGAASVPVKVNRTVTVLGSNPKQREMCLHGAGSAPVKVNRIVTVLGSNPEQEIWLPTKGRQRHSPGFEPKAAGDASSR